MWALRNPESADIYVTEQLRGFDLKRNWCASDGIKLLPYSESGMDVTYRVQCNGEPKFNVRMIFFKDTRDKFDISPYRNPSVEYMMAECPA